LREAIETGVVKIEIQSPFNKGMEIEQALEDAFGLKASLVVEVNPDLPPEDIKLTTCKAGAEFLRELIKAHHTIGVGWGTTTFELINQLEPLEIRDAMVVQITGGNKRLSVQFRGMGFPEQELVVSGTVKEELIVCIAEKIGICDVSRLCSHYRFKLVLVCFVQAIELG